MARARTDATLSPELERLGAAALETARDVGLRTEHHLNLLTIRRGEAQTPQGRREILSIPRIPVIGTPSPDLVFEDHDILVLFGKETNLIEFAQLSKGL